MREDDIPTGTKGSETDQYDSENSSDLFEGLCVQLILFP